LSFLLLKVDLVKKQRIIFVAGIVLLLAGVASIAPMAYFWNQNRIAMANPAAATVVAAVAPKPAPQSDTITGYPVRLQVPSLAMDLQIVDGVYNEKTHAWSLSRDKVQYALPTVQPNNKAGNTLLYGHYRPEVFARLHKIQPGAEVIVTTDNGRVFSYTFTRSQTVAPSDTSIFGYSGDPRLTIQTCTGAWMQDRQFFFFALSSVQ
jgi:LPXTG-site transpeptidase (sortase) family protein